MLHTALGLCGMGRRDVNQAMVFRGLIEASREAVVVMTPDGQVVYTNPAHDALFNRRVAAWRNDYETLWSPAARGTIEAGMLAALNGGGDVGEGVLEAQDVGGRRFAVWYRFGSLRDADGQVLFHCFLHEHATEARADEVARRERDAAEAANRAKTRFLAAASHDLRQPLQALAMFVTVLSGRDHSPANRKVIDRIEDSLAATDALLSSLLDISKLEAGMVVPAVAEVPAERLLRRMAEEFAPQAQRTGLTLRLVPCRAVLRTDAALLERILRNLLSNAIRYTEQGGILIGCRRRGARLSIEVWDTGPGIPPDQCEAVFREFHRLGQTSRDGHQGLGLGLAIVQRLSHLLDHPVTLRSVPFKGSVFAVEVPLAG